MSSSRQRPAIFHINGIGDYMLALPAVRAVVVRPDTEALVISSSGAHNLIYRDLPPAARLLEVDTPDGRRFDPDSILQELDTCDSLLSFSSWYSSDLDVLVRSFRARGLPTIGYTPEFDTIVDVRGVEHAFDLHFRLAQYMAVEARFTDHAHAWPLDSKAREQARSLRAELGAARLLVIHSETTRSDKEWPAERWQTLFRRLLAEHRDLVVLILDYADRGLVPAGADRVIPCSRVDLESAFALVEAADLFVGVDSCLLHAADFARVPGVGLFGATSPARWGFRFSPHRHVVADGMGSITVDQVLAAVNELLRDQKTPSKIRPRQDLPGRSTPIAQDQAHDHA